MIGKDEILGILEGYDKDNLTIATICSHSSLQIFDGARKEGFKTLGICIDKPPKLYDAYPLAKPDEFMVLDSYEHLLERCSELVEKNVILIPHGSLVEYLTPHKFVELRVPTFGNRLVLEWESDRDIERQWLEGAHIPMPIEIESPEKIDRPVIVKYHGAKGGRGFFIAKNKEEFYEKVNPGEKYTIQEFVLGTRYYLHYFYSPIKEDGYTLSKGTLQMLSIDRRIESNVDEIFKLGSLSELMEAGIVPTFVVTGNAPLVVRESLLPRIFEMGAQVVEKSIELFGGMVGAFCLETAITDNLEFRVFEISARIVAGTNPFVSGSPYADLISENLSTGRRIAQEIKMAAKLNRLNEIIS